MTSQKYLLVKRRGSILITDIQNNEKKVLSQTCGFELLSYKVADDSLYVYSGSNGTIIKEVFPYVSSQGQHNSTSPVTDNLISLYEPKRDNLTATYRWGDIVLTSILGLQIKCYRDSTFLWKKKHKMIEYGPFTFVGLGYQSPVISGDKKCFLFTVYKTNLWGYKRKPKLVEIEIETGKQKTVAKRSDSGSYSYDDKYILFKKNMNWHHKYGIYERSTGKVIYYDEWETAFWLY